MAQPDSGDLVTGRRGGGTLVWAVIEAARFADHAPAPFWAMALAAALVDAPLFRRGRREELTLSTPFTVVIFLLWGATPAIVVQVAAIAIAVLAGRRPARAVVLPGARETGAILAAHLLAPVCGLRPFATTGSGLHWPRAIGAVAATAVLIAVSHGVRVLTRAPAGTVGQARAEERLDLLRTTTSVLLVSPLLLTLRGWWPLLVALPVLAWDTLLRQQARERDRLSREPATGLLNHGGLLDGVRALVTGEFAVVLISVEQFATITRMLGRDVAERVIGEASRRPIDTFGADRVGQLSGESLVVLIPDGAPDRALAETVGAVGLLSVPIEVDDIPFHLDPVGGVSLSPRHGRELGTLLTKSSLAAQAARRQGRPALLYVREDVAVTSRRMKILRR